MGCKCCRWPENACRMGAMVRLVSVGWAMVVLYLVAHCFINDAVVTGASLLLLHFLPPAPTKAQQKLDPASDGTADPMLWLPLAAAVGAAPRSIAAPGVEVCLLPSEAYRR